MSGLQNSFSIYQKNNISTNFNNVSEMLYHPGNPSSELYSSTAEYISEIYKSYETIDNNDYDEILPGEQFIIYAILTGKVSSKDLFQIRSNIAYSYIKMLDEIEKGKNLTNYSILQNVMIVMIQIIQNNRADIGKMDIETISKIANSFVDSKLNYLEHNSILKYLIRLLDTNTITQIFQENFHNFNEIIFSIAIAKIIDDDCKNKKNNHLKIRNNLEKIKNTSVSKTEIEEMEVRILIIDQLFYQLSTWYGKAKNNSDQSYETLKQNTSNDDKLIKRIDLFPSKLNLQDKNDSNLSDIPRSPLFSEIPYFDHKFKNPNNKSI